MGDQTKKQGQMGQGQTGQGHTGQGQTQMDQRQGDWKKDQGDWNKDKGQSQHDWKPGETDDEEQGKGTRPPQPSGTTPLERDQRPINQSR